MLFRNTYTAIDRDMQRIEPGQHQAARLDVYGWSWRLPEAYEAAFFPDYSRTSYPLTPTEFFPDCGGDPAQMARINAARDAMRGARA